eukprot:4774666-Prymnesium_polylepis.1
MSLCITSLNEPLDPESLGVGAASVRPLHGNRPIGAIGCIPDGGRRVTLKCVLFRISGHTNGAGLCAAPSSAML